MRVFLKELIQEWQPVKYIYRHSPYSIKYQLKRYIAIFNRELVILFFNLKSNTVFCVALAILLAASGFMASLTSTARTTEIISTVLTVIVGFVSVIVAGAVFITSQANSSALRDHQIEKDLIKALHTLSPAFQDPYKALDDKLTVEQKWSLINAHAAQTVLNQSSYEKFADWFISVQEDLRGGYNEYLIGHPYTVAENASANKSYPIEDGIRTLESKFENLSNYQSVVLSHTTPILNKLKAATANSRSVSFMSSYAQGPFLGDRLGRVLFGGFAAVGAVILMNSVKDQNYNFIVNTDLHSSSGIVFCAIFITFGALLLSVRYILLFLNVLRSDSQYGRVNSVYLSPRNGDEVYQYPQYPSVKG